MEDRLDTAGAEAHTAENEIEVPHNNGGEGEKMVFVEKRRGNVFCCVLTCSGAAVLMSVITPRKRVVVFFYSEDTMCTETSTKQRPPILKTEGRENLYMWST